MISVLLAVVAAAQAAAFRTVAGSQQAGSLQAALRTVAGSRQVHLAFAGDASRMAISWLSLKDSYEPATVRYGYTPGQLTLSATGSTHDSLMHRHHDVVVQGLEPNTTVFFVAGGGAAVSSFTTRPVPSRVGAFVASILGDMGINNSLPTITRMLQRPHHAFVLHVGDVSYADDSGSIVEPDPGGGVVPYQDGKGYELLYDRFGVMVEPLTSVKPYMVSPGNHDVSCRITSDAKCIGSQRNFTPFNTRWRMPSRESNGSLNMWWSFEFERTHFASVSTETDFPGAPTTPETRLGGGRGGGFGDQLGWLDRDLERAAADPFIDWIVVLGHRPLYESEAAVNDWPVDTELHVRRAFEPLFAKHGVDVYVSGHKHYYERLAPIAESGVACDQVAEPPSSAADAGEGGMKHCTHYVIHGSAGNNEPLSKRGTAHSKLVRGSDYINTGFLEFEVANRSHAAIRFIRSVDGLIGDEGWITKVSKS